ncbi:uncharacterized protein [Miscanthus floridulus]|uniref:uncharacterized protein n=1 Tax=Miscanthus floridulus TaxID=154761 RepID=UPI00345941D9
MAGEYSPADSDFDCSHDFLMAFRKSMRGQVWRVNAMLLTDVVLAGVIVAMGAYGQRYRHHPFTRFVFLGATTLFLPILSYVVSSTDRKSNNYSNVTQVFLPEEYGLVATCDGEFHSLATVTWAFLVQIVVINTSTVVASDDREGRNIPPPYELFVQGVWTFYLGASSIKPVHFVNDLFLGTYLRLFIEFSPFALICVKIVFKLYAFGNAQRSFALGRNPHLVSGYSQQLQQVEEGSPHGEPPVGDGQHVHVHVPPPPLMVMGEEVIQVEEQPQGYVVKDVKNMVTVDRVWRLDDTLLAVPRPLLLKDLCLSFALFKLLRCRFARYKLGNAGSKGVTTDFFWGLLMKDGEHVRIFRLIADEVSFVHDYYYSSLPICYAKRWLHIWSLCISLLSLGYCIVVACRLGLAIWQEHWEDIGSVTQMVCSYRCWREHGVSSPNLEFIGRTFLVVVALFLIVTLVMISEIRDIGSYICSNWTKVGLICWYVNHTSRQHFVPVQKWVALLLRCRCKLMKHWNEKMGQCSVLVLQPRTVTPLGLLRRVLRLPDKERSVRVSPAVKACIIDALRSHKSTGASLRRSRVHENFPGARNSKGTSDAILTWHIATCILEARHPCQHDQEQEQGSPPAVSDDRITAVHLSRYCTYLVAWYPELLPDDVAWSKSVYKAVKKDAGGALAARRAAPGTPEAEYEQLLKLLGENSRHEVLRDGARLATELVEYFTAAGEGDEATWKLLAGFWSEMILYAAPSKNEKGHLEAVARGGELITLLWALLFHAGIVSRGETAATPAGTV